MIKPLLYAVFLVFLALNQASSAEKNGKLDGLATSVQKYLDQKKESKPTQPGGYPNVDRQLLAQLQNAISRNDSAQIESALQGLSFSIDSETLRAQCEEISSQLRNQREAKEKQAVNEIQAALKRAAEAVHSAKKTADLDAVLHELGQLGELRNSQSPSGALSSALNKVQPALQFVTHWQDYLSNLAVGNTQAACEALNQLTGANNMNQPDLLPRSELLARRQSLMQPARPQVNRESKNEKPPVELVVEKPLLFEKSTQSITFSIKSIDELDDVVKAYQSIQNKPEFREFQQANKAMIEALRPLNCSYIEWKAGLPTHIEIASSSQNATSFPKLIVPIRAELIKLVLPRYLGLPSKTKPKPGESAYDFLNQITEEAISKNDYLLASRVREALMLLDGASTNRNIQTQGALFVTAHNQETAGQYALAVKSYQQALASGTDLVPPKIIGERLDAIKSEHPQEFAQGLELFLSPPDPRFPPGFGSGRPMQQPMPVLHIPAATSSETPAKK